MLLSNLDVLATAPGGVARLRELILTLAVQGKLVPQDPADEPASELLKKIRVEKDRLIAAGRIKRDKPVAEIGEDEKPFDLPAKWQWVRLLDLLPEFQNGASSRGDTGGKPITVLRLADIKNKRISLAETRQIPIAAPDIEKYQLAEGDILITRVNGSADIVGQFNLCDRPVDAIYCDHFIRMRIDRRWIAPSFCALLGESALVRASIKSLFITTAGQKTVNQSHIGSLLLPLPPLAEQSRIVTRVEELMRLCDALEAKGQLEATQHAQLVSTLLDQLTASNTPDELHDNWRRVAQHFDLLLDRPAAVDALEQTILQLAVRGLLVAQDPTDEPTSTLLQLIRVEKDRLILEGKIKRDKPLAPIAEDEKPFELPEGWEWVRLRELVTHLGDGLHGTPHYSPTGEYFFVNGNNLCDGSVVIKPETKRVDKSEFEKYKKPLDATTVLLSINGTLGNVAFYNGEQVVLGKSACYFNLTSGLSKSFVRTLLECSDFQDYAIGSATGSTIKNLGLKAIGDWPIALPPLAEQSRIVTRVASLRRLCADLRQRLASASTRQALLAEVLVQGAAQS